MFANAEQDGKVALNAGKELGWDTRDGCNINPRLDTKMCISVLIETTKKRGRGIFVVVKWRNICSRFELLL